jgi:hypothetical protein
MGKDYTVAMDKPITLNVKVILGVLAALFNIGAGIYLTFSNSAADIPTVFDAMMHGAGCYFIGRGLWMIYELATQAE